MQLLPSISVISGRTARLKQGDYSSEKIYDVSPIDIAKQFEDSGIHQVHLVDLDGAKKGSPVNYETLELIKGYTSLEVNFAGGIHTDGDFIKAIEHGAQTITAGTVAVNNPDLFASWIMSYGREKLMLSSDVENGNIKVRGWQQTSNLTLLDQVQDFYSRGLKYLKSTEIPLDGTMGGPPLELYKEIIQNFSGICLYASGGVRSMDDIKALRDIGVYGVIFGRAFYEGKITLKEIEDFVK